MRANDISRRIGRLYAGLGAIASTNFEGVTVEISGFDSNGFPKFSLNAQGNYSQDDLEFIAASSIHAVANFVDHCVAACQMLGIPETEPFKVTAGSLSLRILRDLDTKDKHPASKRNDSDLFPQLIDVRRIIRMVGSKDNPGRFEFTFGVNSKQISVLDRNQIDTVITGVVKNAKTGAMIAPLHFLLEDGVSQWEKFLTQYRTHFSVGLGLLTLAEKIWRKPK
jgi:hypothetical protein